MSIPVVHSVIAPDALQAEIALAYHFEDVARCALLRSWTNDVYIVSTNNGDHYLKVYGFGWRMRSEVCYEIELVDHLAAKGVEVALPVPRRNGTVIGMLPAPEGERCCVLFTAASGEKPRPPFSSTLYHRFGRATAQVHTASDDFTSRYARTPLDLALLIDRPLQIVSSALAHRQDDLAYLFDLGMRVRACLASFAARGLDWGVCHGDLSLDNVQVTRDDRIIFYDFDSGGPGWRASDPYGVFAYAMLDGNGFWDAFLAGYTEVRSFGTLDLAAVPYFVVAQHLWGMGHDVGFSATRTGSWRVGNAYFDHKLAALRRWDTEFLGTIIA